jgi:thiamine-phosphate pyrophosphorylase
MKLFVVTANKDFPNETMVVTKMFESGLTTLHLRKSRHTTKQLMDYIEEIPAHFHNRIVIHSHHKLAIKYKLKGIHLTSTHLSKKRKYFFVRLRLRLYFGTISKSRSYSRLQQIYSKEDYTFNYYLVGTLFNSLTGDFYSGYFQEGVLTATKNSGKNLVARGGTTPLIIKKAYDLGFYGIAFNSYIWEGELPYSKFMEVLDTFKQHNIELE